MLSVESPRPGGPISNKLGRCPEKHCFYLLYLFREKDLSNGIGRRSGSPECVKSELVGGGGGGRGGGGDSAPPAIAKRSLQTAISIPYKVG